MNRLKNMQTIEQIALRYGILKALALAGFFLLMKAVGLEHNLELRALNIFVLSGFVWMAVKAYKKNSKQLVYFKGFGVGLLTSAVGVVLFSMLVLLYITLIDPEFLEVIREREPFGAFLNPLLIAFTIVLEGMASGYLVTFALLQYYRPNHITGPVEEVV